MEWVNQKDMESVNQKDMEWVNQKDVSGRHKVTSLPAVDVAATRLFNDVISCS